LRRLVDTSVVGDAIEYAEPRRALAEALISKLRQVRAPFLVSLDDYRAGSGAEPAAEAGPRGRRQKPCEGYREPTRMDPGLAGES
jgi:hypothetical protein